MNSGQVQELLEFVAFLKKMFAFGLTSLAAKSINRMIIKPIMKPTIGERKREDAMMNMPFIRMALIPNSISTAPMIPPINACDELDGIPKYHVIMFQRLALIKAAKTTAIVTFTGAATSLPTVLATAKPNIKGPIKFAEAAIINAALGVIPRDEIMVATTLALSWKPFRKSKTNAITTKVISTINEFIELI